MFPNSRGFFFGVFVFDQFSQSVSIIRASEKPIFRVGTSWKNWLISWKNYSEKFPKIADSKRNFCYRDLGNLLVSKIYEDKTTFFGIVGNTRNRKKKLYFRKSFWIKKHFSFFFQFTYTQKMFVLLIDNRLVSKLV